MPLLVGNLQRLAEANKSYDPPQGTEMHSPIPRDPRSGRRESAAHRHVAPRQGEPDAHMHVTQNVGNAAHVFDNGVGNAAQNHPGNAAHNYQGNEAKTLLAMQPTTTRAVQLSFIQPENR